MDLKSKIREIPNFPKEGILFYDITTLLKDAEALHRVIEKLADFYRGDGIQKVVAIESRGFILGAPLAFLLGVGFVPVRKTGKLPSEVYEVQYSLEYGTNTLAIHKDAVNLGEKVLVVDDLLATGGTVAATVELIRKLGGAIVGLAFLIELLELRGRDKLKGYPVLSLISY
jgi:adenine phosphoribosyltransferase